MVKSKREKSGIFAASHTLLNSAIGSRIICIVECVGFRGSRPILAFFGQLTEVAANWRIITL